MSEPTNQRVPRLGSEPPCWRVPNRESKPKTMRRESHMTRASQTPREYQEGGAVFIRRSD
jgi:hypothetical protein